MPRSDKGIKHQKCKYCGHSLVRHNDYGNGSICPVKGCVECGRKQTEE